MTSPAQNRKGLRWAGAILALLLVAAAWAWFRRSPAETGRYTHGRVDEGSIRTTISATGTLQALLTVQVGSQVTGRVQSLHADFNSYVRRSQVIARIDPATFQATLVRARADLEDARAGLVTARAGRLNQAANLEATRVAKMDAERVYNRATELASQGVASERDLEAAQAAFQEAEARHRQAEAQSQSADAAIEQAMARIKQAEATVTLAEVNLEYTVITSPVDGVVVSRNVDVGQTVAASLQAPTLFVIANDLTRMQVVASVDEADIGSIGPESKVSFGVDAFAGETFPGRIDQIRLNPIVTQNVVTYSVIVLVANPDLKLRPGMTANTTFTVAEAASALKLPNAALRFWPADVPRERERELLADAGSGRPEESTEGSSADGRASGTGAENPAPGATTERSPIESEAGVLRFPKVSRPRWRPRVVWVPGQDDRPEPKVVWTGITDGSATEIRQGSLSAGDTIIVGSEQSLSAGRPNNPFGSPMAPRGGAAGRSSGGRRP